MKISINSTFSYIKFNLNYGSALQCFALQKYLKMRGHYAEHLRDYRANPKFIVKRFKNIRYFKNFMAKARALSEMQSFIRHNMIFSKRGYLSDRALKKHCPGVDCHIVGSDQVWHNANSFRYLDYAPDNALKLSYAASFGKSDISEEMKNEIKPLLKRFNGISVREKSGVNIIASMGMKAKWVLDPTLLIDREQYPYKENGRQNYCYCYFLNLNKKEDVMFDAIKNAVKDKGKELLVTAPLNYMMFSEDNLVFPSVEDWLGLYKNADCIFTNTYHGLLFCIIFKKRFVLFDQNMGLNHENERFYSLLDMLNLNDRLITVGGGYFPEDVNKLMNKEIDYDRVYAVINSKRKETDEFFRQFDI